MITIRRLGLRDTVTNVLASMKTDMNDLDDLLARFESRLSEVVERLNHLESRVSKLEKLLENRDVESGSHA
ncbi:MAG: hypothetical protein DRZ82_07180 [Thermoprotei archaeon]|nr:MAG: hypothetical protein DRZ82_07180 [Thermoprotei archaeon]